MLKKYCVMLLPENLTINHLKNIITSNGQATVVLPFFFFTVIEHLINENLEVMGTLARAHLSVGDRVHQM